MKNSKSNIPLPPPPPSVNNTKQQMQQNISRKNPGVINKDILGTNTPANFKEMLNQNLRIDHNQSKSKPDFSMNAINTLNSNYFQTIEDQDMYNFDAIQQAQSSLREKENLMNIEVRNIDENLRRTLTACYVMCAKHTYKDNILQLMEDTKNRYNISMNSNWIEHKYPDKMKLEQEFKTLAAKGEVVLEEKLKTLFQTKETLQKGLATIKLAMNDQELKHYKQI